MPIQSIIKIISLSCILIIGSLTFLSGQNSQVMEAENATLSGTANIVTCSSASGGQMVKDIGSGVGNALEFKNINLAKGGAYFITISYFSTNSRTFTYQINKGTAKTNSVPASGAWCYQGGIPANYTFLDTFNTGLNTLIFYDSPIIDKLVISSDTLARQPSAFYVSASMGNDDNDGLTPETAWQSLSKVNTLVLVPGDSLLFKTGDIFTGKLTFLNEGGTADKPILVSGYGSINKPVIDGDGFLSAIHVVNSGYIHFFDLEIVNNGGQPRAGEPTNLRYGIFLENNRTDGTSFDHYRFSYIEFRNIYPTDQITDDDQSGVHAYGFNISGSWGDEKYPT